MGGLFCVSVCMLQHCRPHNGTFTCIDSCVVEWTEIIPLLIPFKTKTHQSGMAGKASDVEDPGSTLKDSRGVWRELGPHQMFLSSGHHTELGPLRQDALLEAGGGL